MSAAFLINSSMGTDVAFTGLITLLHSELVFLNAKDSINIYLTSVSYIILVTAEVNLSKKNSKGLSLSMYNFKNCLSPLSQSCPKLQSCCKA